MSELKPVARFCFACAHHYVLIQDDPCRCCFDDINKPNWQSAMLTTPDSEPTDTAIPDQNKQEGQDERI